MTVVSDPRGTMPMRSGIGEADYGTPKSDSDVLVNVTIDGQSHLVPLGTSIMPGVRSGAVTMKMISKTSMTSMNGTILMSLIVRRLGRR